MKTKHSNKATLWAGQSANTAEEVLRRAREAFDTRPLEAWNLLEEAERLAEEACDLANESGTPTARLHRDRAETVRTHIRTLRGSRCQGCAHPRADHHDDGCWARDVDDMDEDRTVECNCLGWWEPGTPCPYDDLCPSCARPEDEHRDEMGLYTPCLEQIGETLAARPITHNTTGSQENP